MLKTLMTGIAAIALGGCATISQPVNAASTDQSEQSQESALEMRLEQLVPLLDEKISPEDYFDQNFLNAVPKEKFIEITRSLIVQNGKPQSARIVEKATPHSAKIEVTFEKAVATMSLVVAVDAPHRVRGLIIQAVEARNDSLKKIDAEFKALDGNSGYIIAELKDGVQPRQVAGYNTTQQFAIGSTFKLYILAELAGQIEAGQRQWYNVTPLAHRSFSSNATKKWPENAPVTLQTLATQMISVSDNSATDTLLHLLGREQVERKLATIGHSQPDKTLPFLSTVEAFAIKSSDDLHAQFSKTSEAGQRQFIAANTEKLGFDDVDNSVFGNGPRFIDTVEWFASPADITSLMDYIRRTQNDTMLQIMAVNSGLGEEAAKKWQYLGYKGGSEPGVISMSYLLQSKKGNWYVITGSWNSPDKFLDESKLVSLMGRLLNEMVDK